MDGVKVFVVTPDEVPPENRNRLLIHIHGGCYVLFPGEAGATEAITMAGLEHFKVVSVDYRMPPEAYFPTAVDDVLTVLKAAEKTTDPKNIAIFGTSAGGALTLEVILSAKEKGVPLPGAISAGTPMSDVTKTGDSFYTNELVDNVLVSRDGFCDAATVVYAKGHDLKDPLLSPVYGDMHGFPPAILTTGTRDLLLSNTVRSHRALRAAGVEAQLEVYEGQSHAQYLFDDRLQKLRSPSARSPPSSTSISASSRLKAQDSGRSAIRPALAGRIAAGFSACGIHDVNRCSRHSRCLADTYLRDIDAFRQPRRTEQRSPTAA